MTNPFGTGDMAAGYATSRPPVHRRVLEQALWGDRFFRRALDVGCGAGVSTRALEGFASNCIGLEPAAFMLHHARGVAPCASFIAGAAEAIPLRDHTVDLITAAGSLNYADLDLFFPEAARVLTHDGVLAVYDFGPGRTFRTGRGLEEWFDEFSARYPSPPHEARELSPAILARVSSGFGLHRHREFEIAIPMTPSFYVDYVLTETNVAAAVRRGTPHGEIKSWCAASLASLWNGAEREVLFRGYFACLKTI